MTKLGFMKTYSGNLFYPDDIENSTFCIEDVAHSLSKLCRFGGHTKGFYSVAQHSVLVSHLVPSDMAMTALLHDATEAYLVDLPRAVKYMLPDYLELEDKLMSHLAKIFSVSYPFPPEVKVADNIALATERRDLMLPGEEDWGLTEKPVPEHIDPMSPTMAFHIFMTRYKELKDTQVALAGT